MVHMLEKSLKDIAKKMFRIPRNLFRLIAAFNVLLRKSFQPLNFQHENYSIEGTINLDPNPCFTRKTTYPPFQNELQQYQLNLKKEFESKSSYSSFKFGDGDYYFLNQIEIGSAQPGKRALSRRLAEDEMKIFVDGAKNCDRYFCEIYPENRKMFHETFPKISQVIPAEFNYGLIANRWMLREFGSSIGIIGADEKIDLIRSLMEYQEYQEYLGLEKFSDYITVPQKFACDDLQELEVSLSKQLQNAKSQIFLFGVGHVKSGIAWQLPGMHKAIYIDVGSGIDALAGVIDSKRPYFGDWINFRLRNGFDYSSLDLLQLESSKTRYLR